jgi:SPX domain protein involved in polyphosphate accumulation
MKFGKRIRGEAFEGWEDFYFDYKASFEYFENWDVGVIDVLAQELKHILKPMISDDPNTPPTDKMEEIFIAAIMKEIDRVDTFFTFQENQFYAEFRSLCQKVLQCSQDVYETDFMIIN